MFKYSIKDVGRMWTREEWKRLSRWGRLVQKHMDKLNPTCVLYNIMVLGQDKHKKGAHRRGYER